MVVFDTSAWIEYFSGSKKGSNVKNYVESKQEIFTPSVCLAELKLKYEREMQNQTTACLNFVFGRSVIVSIDKETALLSADNKLRHKLYLIDAVIYSTAQLLKRELVTSDNDMRNLPGVVFLDGKG